MLGRILSLGIAGLIITCFSGLGCYLVISFIEWDFSLDKYKWMGIRITLICTAVLMMFCIAFVMQDENKINNEHEKDNDYDKSKHKH